MRVVIFGVGAMGCLFAARLNREAQVTVVGHWPEQLLALERHGIRLLERDGSTTTARVGVTNDPLRVSSPDLVLVLVKSTQTQHAAAMARRLMGSDPRCPLVLTLQNGLGNREVLAREVGWERTACGVTAQGATVLAPGRVRHAGHGPTFVGVEGNRRGALEPVARLLNDVGLRTELREDGEVLRWEKLALNAAINPLTALLGVSNGRLAREPGTHPLLAAAAREVVAVARARGLVLFGAQPGLLDRVLEVCRQSAQNRSSMLQDISARRRTEIDAICGEVVKKGREVQVATPINALFLQRVHELESRPGPDRDGGHARPASRRREAAEPNDPERAAEALLAALGPE